MPLLRSGEHSKKHPRPASTARAVKVKPHGADTANPISPADLLIVVPSEAPVAVGSLPRPSLCPALAHARIMDSQHVMPATTQQACALGLPPCSQPTQHSKALTAHTPGYAPALQ